MAHVILLHGSWLGSWMWDEVAMRLEREGHQIVAPELVGDGTLDEHRDQVLDLFQSGVVERNAVVVAHSYSGMPATAAAAVSPGDITKIVYLDAFVPRGEQCAFDILPGIKPVFEATVGEDGLVPALPLEAFGITDPEEVARIGSRLRPWPLHTHTATSPGLPDSVDGVFLQFAQGDFFNELAADLEVARWTVERLDLPHLAPVTHAEEVAQAVLRHVG